MKTRLLTLALLLGSTFPLFAQGNHIGTWRLVSATYTNASMKSETVDQTKMDELKIITPTHFIWMSQVPDKHDKNKKTFGSGAAGRYTLDGIQYVESLDYATWNNYQGIITDFTIRVDGDKLYQMGALSNADGAKTILQEVWQKEVLTPQPGKHVGTWNLVSQRVTDPQGKKSVTDMAKYKQMKIITPTHWMFISQDLENEEKKFAWAGGGHYTLHGDQYSEKIEYGRWTDMGSIKTEYTLRVDGEQLYMTGSLWNADGSKTMYDEVYVREKDKEAMKKVAGRIK